MVHADLSDPSMDLRGVVARDRESALFVFSQTTTSPSYPPEKIHLPGLDDHKLYEVSRLRQPVAGEDVGQSPLAWSDHAVTVTGGALRLVGLQPPTLLPEQAQVIVLTEVPAT
jgi:alpha-galactosidase